jgi:6-phosphogluconolactonase
MKFSKLRQLVLVSTIGLLVATCVSGCLLVSIDYVYVACSAGSGTNSAGLIQVYAADAASGALRQVYTSVSSGGNKPVALALASDYLNLYVANQSNNSVVHFAINGDGSLTQKDTVTVATTPVSLAVNATNTYLYVVSGTSSATLTEYSLSSGTIGAAVATSNLTIPGHTGDAVVPTAVAVLTNNNASLPTTNGVYVTAYDQAAYNPSCPTCVTSSANPGWIFGYTVGSGGALTVAPNSPFQAGVKPVAIAVAPTNRFLFVTDFANNELIGYTIQSTSTLAFMLDGPFATGSEPSAVTIDPRGAFMYVANALSNSVSAYTIDQTTGTPSATISPAGTPTTDSEPIGIAVDPALGYYVYTVNQVGDSITGFKLNPSANTGGLTTDQSSPYPVGFHPTALVIIPNGNHAVEVVTP